MKPAHYFVTDIETDGPNPQENSMLSFACVVISENGDQIDEFETVLEPRIDRTQHIETME